MDELVARIVSDGDDTLEAFAEGRRFGAFFAGLRSGAEDMRQPLTLSAAVALTSTWITDEGWEPCDDDDDDPGSE